jgi:hypothetical protein
LYASSSTCTGQSSSFCREGGLCTRFQPCVVEPMNTVVESIGSVATLS